MHTKRLICACATAATVWAPPLRAQQAVLAPGTALRVELDHRARSRSGTIVKGHLTEPVYLVDREVIPAGSLVSGTIRNTYAGPRQDRVRRLLAADFTPPRVPEVVFDTLILPGPPGQGPSTIAINAPGTRTEASVLTLGTQAKKQSLFARFGDYIKQRRQDLSDGLKHHQFIEAVEKYAVGQLPYHPEILWSNTRFNADLASAATLATARDAAHIPLPVQDLHGRLPEGTLHARLLSSLSSATAKRGDAVDAIITQPLLSPDRSHLLVPEGTLLHGVIVQTKAARSLGRNGALRFAFRNLDLPTGDSTVLTTEIHGRLSAAETAPGQHVQMDEEGETKASDGPGKYAEPLLLGILAANTAPETHRDGTVDQPGAGAQTVASNGFGLIARVISLSTQNTNALQGFAYYALAKSIYFNFISKGHDTTFAHDTEIQVTLSER